MHDKINSAIGCIKAQPSGLPEPANKSEEPITVRIRAKVRDHAALIGQTRPAPLILIDAVQGAKR